MAFFRKGLTRLGDIFPLDANQFINRTGATLLKGSVAMLDILGTQAETTSIIEGDEASSYANLTPITQLAYDSGFPIVVALEDVDDNQKGNFVLSGITQVLTLSDDQSITDADRGDEIAMVITESVVAVSAAAVTANRRVGIFMENADALLGPNLKTVIWTGGIPAIGISRDS